MADATFEKAQDVLHRLADGIDLTGNGLGEDLLDVIVEGIVERSLGEQAAPSGAAWAPNKEPYASSRRKRGKPIGVLTGDMLSLQQVRGTREITPTLALMTYGTSSEARRKLLWFTKGRPGQEPRPVLGLDPEIVARLKATVLEHLRRSVGELT